MTTDAGAKTAHSAQRYGTCVLVLVLATLVAFLAIGAIGATEAGHDARVLPSLDPVIQWVRTGGLRSLDWLRRNVVLVGRAVTGAAMAVGLLGLIAGRLRATPLLLLAAGVALATWGQILVLADETALGGLLYGGGILCALGLGIWCPMTRLLGFPQLPLPVPDGEATPPARAGSAARLPLGWECGLVFLLTVIALLARAYALTELPSAFDLETVGMMIQSRTAVGLLDYFRAGLLTNAPGMVHMLTQAVLFRVFGTSIYTVRLGAVFWGTAAVPLLYTLVRRLAGVAPAVVAALLCISAPEALFWSRSEDAFFAPIAVLALLTAHLALWMLERFSVWSVLATALWMPFCRYFYSPGMILFTYPVILYGHAVVFVRGAWRKAWYIVPLLAAGVALWVLSLTMLFSYVNGWGWRFVHPAMVYGAPAWRKQGEFRDVSLPQLVRMQAVSVSENFASLVDGMVHHDTFATHWYLRYTIGKSPSLNVGFAVVLALGVGYLLGQVYERRAALLLLWILLGMMPACLSNEATVRRMALMFPAAQATVAIMFVSVVRIVRTRAARWLAWLTAALVAAAVVAVVWTSLASHFLLTMAPVAFSGQIRFVQPFFDESDAIFSDIEERNFRLTYLLGNLDRFLHSPLCYEYVRPKDWLRQALRPHCETKDQVYTITLPPARVESLRHAPLRRVTYLMEQTSSGREHTALVRALYPSATVHEYRNRVGQLELVAVTVDRQEIEALHQPWVIGPSDPAVATAMQTKALAGVTLALPNAPVALATDQQVEVRGGLLIDDDGWYRFQIEPACAAAVFTIDGQPASGADLQPESAGVHSFTIALPDPTACALPLRVVTQAADGRAAVSVRPEELLSPTVAAITDAKASPVVPYAGYGAAMRFAAVDGVPVDVGVDAQGRVSILIREAGGWRVRRFHPDGVQEAEFQPDLAADRGYVAMAVRMDGSYVFASEAKLLFYDSKGRQIGIRENQLGDLPSDMVLWREDRILLSMPRRDSLAVFARDGTLQGEFRQFRGGPGRLYNPVAVSVSPSGEVLVIQEDGLALLFSNPSAEWNPAFVRAFRAGFARLPAEIRRCAFDGPDRILVPDGSNPMTLVYTLDGERMLAADPQRDLSRKGFGPAGGFQSTGDRLYVIDPYQRCVWSVNR